MCFIWFNLLKYGNEAGRKPGHHYYEGHFFKSFQHSGELEEFPLSMTEQGAHLHSIGPLLPSCLHSPHHQPLFCRERGHPAKAFPTILQSCWLSYGKANDFTNLHLSTTLLQ